MNSFEQEKWNTNFLSDKARIVLRPPNYRPNSPAKSRRGTPATDRSGRSGKSRSSTTDLPRRSHLVDLVQPNLRQIFEEALGEGLKMLWEHLYKLLEFNGNFVVLFCGGSFMNLGLRQLVSREMDKIKAKATRQGLQVKEQFLPLLDPRW